MQDKNLAGYIKRETLSQALVDKVPADGVSAESYKLAGHDILLGVAKLATGLSSDSKP